MRKIILITTALFLLFTFNSCKKEPVDPHADAGWCHSATTPAGCSTPAIGSATPYVCFKDGQTLPILYYVWTINGFPATNNKGQMLYGAAIRIDVGAGPWNQIVTYFATNGCKPYVGASYFIDGGPGYENWELIKIW